jgi:predicted component of type VI protein secretion system
MIDLTRLREGWTSGARDAAAAERLESEIAKLGSLAGEEPAWPMVRDEAMAVLRGSPDLAAAVYLTQAASVLDGLEGLADGLGLVAELMRAHWEMLRPPLERPRARRAALAWLAERSARTIAAAPDPVRLERAIARVVEADTECERRFAEPLLGALRRRLESLRPTPQSAAAAAVTPPEATVPAAADARGDAVARIAAAAEYFQRSEPHSPIGPLLRRALVWSELGFEEVFRELLARAPEARGALWETLGLKPEPKR